MVSSVTRWWCHLSPVDGVTCYQVKVSSITMWRCHMSPREGVIWCQVKVPFVTMLRCYLSPGEGVICHQEKVSYVTRWMCHLSPGEGVICHQVKVSSVTRIRCHLSPGEGVICRVQSWLTAFHCTSTWKCFFGTISVPMETLVKSSLLSWWLYILWNQHLEVGDRWRMFDFLVACLADRHWTPTVVSKEGTVTSDTSRTEHTAALPTVILKWTTHSNC
jgi:hypothetical protein